MFDYFWLWSEMIVRWVHVIAGVAWIGSSFYFIALDLSLKPGKELPKEANGQAWQVHGGGFYNLVKYLVLDITQGQAVLLSLGGILVGWVVYDGLCRSPLGRNDLVLALSGLIFLIVLSYIYTQIFSHRGAFMQMGISIGTMMVANVAMVIIPGQKKVVKALKAGEEPNPIYGARGKQRSLHNNYLTLPVIFSGFFPRRLLYLTIICRRAD